MSERNNYTCSPNMLIDGYHELHPQDKWLFVCLSHLCGKERKRALSLRYISKRTGFAPSVLIDDKRTGKPGMLKRLQSAGLIRVELINGQYHIIILDIWTLNEAFYKEHSTCSDSEHSSNPPVRIPNTPVSNTNANRSETEQPRSKSEQFCSENERPCSDSGTRVILDKTINKITKDKNEESDVTPTSSLGESSLHTHPSSVGSDFSEGLISTTSSQGGVINPSSSDKGVSSSAQSATLNLANAQPLSQVAQHISMQQSSKKVACTTSDTHPIAILPDKTLQKAQVTVIEVKEHVPGMGGYTKEKNQDEVKNIDAVQDDNIPTGETLNNDAPRGVMENETVEQACVTSIDEVKILTQEQFTLPVDESSSQTPAMPPNLNVAASTDKKPGKTRTPRETAKKRDLLVESPQEVQAVVTEWRTIFKKPVGITQTLIEQATELAKFEPEAGEVIACRLWMYATDKKKWYSTHGMHLGDVVRAFPKFRSLGDIPDERTKKRSIDRSNFSQQSLDKEFYPAKEPKNQQKEKVYAF